jgi:hypothetical protein
MSQKLLCRAKVVVEVIGILFFLWLLCITVDDAFAQEQLRTQVALQQQTLNTIVSQGGTFDQMNAHMHNTDEEVQRQRDFSNRLRGLLYGLGGVQGLNLILASITLKRTAPTP